MLEPGQSLSCFSEGFCLLELPGLGGHTSCMCPWVITCQISELACVLCFLSKKLNHVCSIMNNWSLGRCSITLWDAHRRFIIYHVPRWVPTEGTYWSATTSKCCYESLWWNLTQQGGQKGVGKVDGGVVRTKLPRVGFLECSEMIKGFL